MSYSRIRKRGLLLSVIVTDSAVVSGLIISDLTIKQVSMRTMNVSDGVIQGRGLQRVLWLNGYMRCHYIYHCVILRSLLAVIHSHLISSLMYLTTYS